MKSIKTSQISLFARLIIEYGLFQLSKSGLYHWCHRYSLS